MPTPITVNHIMQPVTAWDERHPVAGPAYIMEDIHA
jgi:hypothetical protein